MGVHRMVAVFGGGAATVVTLICTMSSVLGLLIAMSTQGWAKIPSDGRRGHVSNGSSCT
jgi:hypothetical protein